MQQILNQREYLKFKKLVNKLLNDEELKETIRAVFIEGEVSTTPTIEIKPLDSGKNSLPDYDFNLKSDETFEEFIKARI